MSSIIECKNLSVVLQGKSILKDVSISISQRDFITIIGPNGAGKSMLLKCLMGFYKPSAGKVTKKRRLRIGYVPQRIALDNSMPINVKRFLSLRKKVISENLEKTAEETNINAVLNKPLSILSGGELQRVLLARSLIDDPEILILDEPAQNLDISGQLSFYKLLERVYEQRSLSILMVSHDLHMVMASTKKVICLFHHICCSGEPSTITQDPEFVSLFGTDMANMMAVYQHSHNHKHDKLPNV